MKDNANYGSTFLAELDRLSGRSHFSYNERKKLKAMDQEAMTIHMRRFGYDFYKSARDDSPEQLASLVVARLAIANSLNRGSLSLIAVSVLLLLLSQLIGR